MMMTSPAMAMAESSPFEGEWRVADIISGDENISVEEIDAIDDAYLKIDGSDNTSILDVVYVNGNSVAYRFPTAAINRLYLARINELGLTLTAQEEDFSYAEGCSFILTVTDEDGDTFDLLMEGSALPSL